MCEERNKFGNLRITTLLFADYVVLFPHKTMNSRVHWDGIQPSVKESGGELYLHGSLLPGVGAELLPQMKAFLRLVLTSKQNMLCAKQ